MTKITKQTFKKAVKGSGGILKSIAKSLNVDRVTVWKFLKKYPDMKTLLEQEQEEVIDVAEQVFLIKLAEKDFNTAREILTKSKRGRARGYGEKIEIESSQSWEGLKNQLEKDREWLKTLPIEVQEAIVKG